MRTKLPVFTEAEGPLEAEDWIRMIEKKLDLIRARDEDKVHFASSQLDDPASDWWEANQASREDEAGEPDWVEFTAVFHENFVPAAIMKMKRDEFRTLRKDNLSVQGYLKKFTQLARYAPLDIPDEEEKIDKFLRGLNDTLCGPLIIHDHASCQSMANKALKSE
ncbi:hypothetical protein E2562_000224 [Oryza meyeriana var. granulata]|uniref:Retrotransposon gag domain-containing protein n=1 Tax=Oryza meyeriana var. granulata TaxID=110450 RepID=A0A6G1CMJ4_9ORYZ|nr:hypothetical protein E2562_000224 [Oryza meyeriana var. granulata]